MATKAASSSVNTDTDLSSRVVCTVRSPTGTAHHYSASTYPRPTCACGNFPTGDGPSAAGGCSALSTHPSQSVVGSARGFAHDPWSAPHVPDTQRTSSPCLPLLHRPPRCHSACAWPSSPGSPAAASCPDGSASFGLYYGGRSLYRFNFRAQRALPPPNPRRVHRTATPATGCSVHNARAAPQGAEQMLRDGVL